MSKPHISLSIGLLAVSTSAILIRLCDEPPSQISLARLAGAGAVFLLWELLTRRSLGMPRRDWLVAAIAAAFLAGHFYFWISSLFMTSINSSVMLLATQPLFALILQHLLLHDRITRRNFLSLFLGLAGCAVIAGGDFHFSREAFLGDMYSVISAGMVACYLVCANYRRGRLVPYLGTVYSFAALILLGVVLARGEPLLPHRQIDWLWYALLVIVPTLVGHSLINRAVDHFPTYVVNLSVLVEPLLTAVFAWIVFGEVMTKYVWAGGAMILASVATEFWPRRG